MLPNEIVKFGLILLYSANISLLMSSSYSNAEELNALQEVEPNSAQLPSIVNDLNEPLTPTTTTMITSIAEKEIPEYRRSCFYADAKLCLSLITNDDPAATNTCQCKAHPTMPQSWYCCNVTQMSMISTCSNISNWNNLHIHNITLPELDLSNSIYQPLHSLAITDGNITQIVKSFSRVSSIKCLNISNNNLLDISQRALSSVPSLKFLDISYNNLSRIPKWNQNQNITVYASGNKRMLCESLLEAIFRDSFKFVDPDTTFCLLSSKYNWFNTADLISIRQLDMARRFQTECPVIPGYGNCTCSPEQIITVSEDGKSYAKVFGRVDCSNLGLIELPTKLPENTFSLNITNNNITNIGKQFQDNPTYQNIIKFFADNNQINSIYELEGTKFIDNFQSLALRNNALSRLPEYLLTNALDSDVGRDVYLAGNKLFCDCNSAKVLKLWLLEHNRDIPDYNDILCRNIPLRVMELQEIRLCQSPHDWTDYIYYLIATEVILLLALITKVSYDYWVFKTAGYLPWPASKMPKLPCDWLCES